MEDHFINHHGQGVAYLCSCGFVSTGPSRRDSHEKICRQLAPKVRPFITAKKNEHLELLGNYSFEHLDPIAIKTSHPEKYQQAIFQTNKPNVLKIYITEHIYRLERNQQKYKALNEAGIEEVESGDEYDFE